MHSGDRTASSASPAAQPCHGRPRGVSCRRRRPLGRRRQRAALEAAALDRDYHTNLSVSVSGSVHTPCPVHTPLSASASNYYMPAYWFIPGWLNMKILRATKHWRESTGADVIHSKRDFPGCHSNTSTRAHCLLTKPRWAAPDQNLDKRKASRAYRKLNQPFLPASGWRWASSVGSTAPAYVMHQGVMRGVPLCRNYGIVVRRMSSQAPPDSKGCAPSFPSLHSEVRSPR